MEHLTDNQVAGRVASHGKIASLTNGFKLENNHSFSILVITKANITGVLVAPDENTLLLVDCKLVQDSVSSLLPINLNDWTPASILELGIDSIDLSTYDVYWGSGYKAE